MRVSVEGEIYLPRRIERLEAKRDDLTFELKADTMGRISEVTISRQVPSDRIHRFRSTVVPGDGDVKAAFNIGGDKELFDLLLLELQRFESALSFGVRGALRRFVWHSYATEVVAETAEERSFASVTGFEFTTGYPQPKWCVEPGGLERVLADPSYESLAIPKAFWREGIAEFHQLRYIQAFYNFYFVLEDFYADGAFTTAETLNRFRKSTEFARITDEALEALAKSPAKHLARLQQLAETLRHGEITNAEGAWKLLVAVRGNLHHYTSKGGVKRGTPYNQRDFEAPAFFAMYLASSAVETREKVERLAANLT